MQWSSTCLDRQMGITYGMFNLATRLLVLLLNISQVSTLLSITTFSKSQSPLAGIITIASQLVYFPFILINLFYPFHTMARMTFLNTQTWSSHFLLIIFMIMMKVLYGIDWSFSYLLLQLHHEWGPPRLLVLKTPRLLLGLCLTRSLCTCLLPLSRKAGSTCISYHFSPFSLWDSLAWWNTNRRSMCFLGAYSRCLLYVHSRSDEKKKKSQWF